MIMFTLSFVSGDEISFDPAVLKTAPIQALHKATHKKQKQQVN